MVYIMKLFEVQTNKAGRAGEPQSYTVMKHLENITSGFHY